MKHEDVPIIVEKKQLKSPTPTTGTALYVLAGVDASHDLFMEVPGPGDDKFIPNTPAEIELKPGTHFYMAQKSLNPGSCRHAA